MGMTPLGLIKLAVPLLLCVILGIVIISPGGSMLLQSLAPFGFIMEYPRGALPNIVANLLLLWAAYSVWRRGALGDKGRAEAAAVIAIASVVPVLLINVPGGSDYYFVNVGTWMAIVFVCAYGIPSFERAFPDPLAPGLVVAAILLVALATGEKRKSAYRLGQMFAELQARVRLVTGESAGAETTTGQRLVALLTPGHQARYALASDIKRTPGAQANETLLAMGVTQAHRAAVFVPPDNVAFWNIAVECRADPFFFPAILGTPMLKGLNPAGLKCPKEPYYGFTDYKDASSEPLSDQQLCARAGSWKIETVFVLETPAKVSEKFAAAGTDVPSPDSYQNFGGFQPIASSLVGGATSGRPIRSQIAPWPAAFNAALIQFRNRHQPGRCPQAAAITCDEICNRHRCRIGYNEGLFSRAGDCSVQSRQPS